MILYTLGFVYNLNRDSILLIDRIKDDWQQFRLNGVGGRKESHDLSMEHAMSREFKEECGIDIDEKRWKLFCVHTIKPSIKLYCYSIILDIKEDFSLSMNEGNIKLYKLSDILYNGNLNYKLVSNLNWLIPLSMDKDSCGGYTKEFF